VSHFGAFLSFASMASAKRHFTYEEDDAPIHPKKPKQQLPSPPVLLNSADCDLGIHL
jgi:hypothetical protein